MPPGDRRARHQRRAVDPRAAAAGRHRQAAHRLDHHRAVALRPGRVRQGGAGLRAGARARPPATTRCAPISPSASPPASTSRARRKQQAGDAGGCGRGLPARGAAWRPGLEDPRQRAVRCRRAAHHSQAMGRVPSACSRISAASIPQSPLQPDVTRKLAVAYAAADRPGEAAAEFERIAANPAEERAVQREALHAVGGPVRQGRQHRPRRPACSRSSSRRIPTPLADAEEARAAPGRLRRSRAATPRGATTGIRRSCAPMRRRGAQRTDRTHYLAAKAQLALGAAGARCVPRRAADRAAQEEPDGQAQGARDRHGRLQARRRLPGRRGDHRRDLRDGRACTARWPRICWRRSGRRTSRARSSRSTTRCWRSRCFPSRSRRSRRTS